MALAWWQDFKEGDEVEFVNWDTKEKSGEAVLVKVWEKKMGGLQGSDFDGHEKFTNEEEMYKTYRIYYGDKVGPDTLKWSVFAWNDPFF